MINVSSAWHRALLNDNRAYKEYITITLTDNTVLNLTEANIWQGGFQIEDAVSDESSFQLGAAIVNKLSLTINNIYDTYSEYVFEDAHVDVQIGLVTDTNTEIIDKGKFIVNTATYNGSLIHLECYDYMTKFDKPYSASQLVYPATLDEIVRDACTNCGLTLGTLNFPHKSFEIATRPDDAQTTFREVISWCAQVAGCFARVAVDGKLEIKWYNQTALENVMDGTDGGVFDSSTPYSTGDSVNGGTFNPWSTGDVVDGGAFTDSTGVHFISSIYSKDISVDDVVITGVSIEIKTEDNGNPVVTHLGGTSGYVVAISDNPLITTTNYSSILAWLQNQLVGFTFRKATISHGSDPSIEAGDVAVIFDSKANHYPIVVSKTSFNVGSAQNTVSAAQTPARNSAARYSAETKNYVELRKKVEAEKDAREIAEAAIRNELAAGSGLYYTEETDQQTPPSTIYYLHNKPFLTDSDIRIKFSTAGIAVTADGRSQNPSWYGLTVNGDMLLNLLIATGINADWIKTGKLDIGGQSNTNGSIRIYNAQGTQIGEWNKDGISVLDGTIGGWSIQPDGIRRHDNAAEVSVGMLPGTNQSGTFLYVNDTSTNAADAWPFAVYKSGIVKMSKAKITGGEISLGGVNNNNGNFKLLDAANRVCIEMSSNNGISQKCIFTNYKQSASLPSPTDEPDSRIIIQNGGIYGSDYSINDSWYDLIHFNIPTYANDYGKGNIAIGNDATSLLLRSASSAEFEMYKTQRTDASSNLNYYTAVTGGVQFREGGITVSDYRYSNYLHDLSANTLTVSGQKSRKVSTADYSDRLLYCYETPSPLFGDIGDGIIGEDGKCYVSIDPIFSETVSLNTYHVFLQKCGQGDCYVSERKGSYFVVNGTPGLEFSWELKAKQIDFDQRRLDVYKEVPHAEETDFAQDAVNHIYEIMKERNLA